MTDRTAQLTTMLGIDHPIVLGPFGGLSSVELTAAVSELGGLGSFGLYAYDAGRIAEAVAAIRAATSRPFNLNVWLPLTDAPTDAPLAPGDYEASVDALRPFFDEVGLPAPEDPPAAYLPSFEEQWDAVLAARPAVASFVFGVPPDDVVEGARARGIRLVGTATSVDEAVALERAAWTRSSPPGSRPAATGCRSCGGPSSRSSARSRSFRRSSTRCRCP